ncbi:MAG TPA: S8 family serine peptidase [Gemmatimonadaceae bacterium]|nr:S8 family serine peptidase [Gemmatimonadaceae bacterium]
MPGSYIVVFKNGVGDVSPHAQQIVTARGGTLDHVYLHTIKGFSAKLSERAARAIAQNPNVAFIEPDPVITVQGGWTLDGDMESSAPWGLDRMDQTSLPLNGTFQYPNTASNVHIYIIDTGIRASHDDFGGRVVSAFDGVHDGYGTSDCYGHGTAVASIAAGSMLGVAKRAKIYSVRIFDCSGQTSGSAVLGAMDWVASHMSKPAVVNMSWEGGKSAAVDDGVEEMIHAGATVVAAAGNYTTSACNLSPAHLSDVLTVGATTKSDSRLSYSDYGSCVSLFAPGSGIPAARSNVDDQAWGYFSGTSAATPAVTGLAALYVSAHPSASPSQVRSAIINAADKGKVSSVGSGSPNLLAHVVGSSTSTSTSTTPQAAPAPSAKFSSSCSDLSCSFKDASSNATAWSWNFGDGHTSTSQNPSHAYSSGGSYKVTLTVANSDGVKSTTSSTVSVSAPTTSTPTSSSGTSSTSTSTSTSTSLSGTWTGHWYQSDGSTGGPVSLSISQSGSTITGTYTVSGRGYHYTGSVSGETLVFPIFSGLYVKLTVSGSTMSGAEIQPGAYSNGGSISWPLKLSR